MVASFPACKRLRTKNAKRSNFKRRDNKQKDQIGDFSSTDQ
jgi:hypothetical protein